MCLDDKHATSFCYVLNSAFAGKQQLCHTAFFKCFRQQDAEGQRAKHQQHVGQRYLFDGHNDAEMVVGAAEPVQKQRMHKVDEHGVGGKNADGLIERLREGTFALRLALQPIQCQAEEEQRAYGVAESLWAELVIGVGQINQRVAFDRNCLVAALHVPGHAGRKNQADNCAVFAQKGDEFLPIAGCQAAAYKNKQIMQGEIVEAIIKEIFSYNAPTRCIQAGMRCPPVECQLENE